MIEMWMFRKLLRAPYTNDEIIKRVKENDLDRSLKKNIMKRKIQYFGHKISKERQSTKNIDRR